MEGWKRITNDPYVLSIIAKGYRLRFTSPPLLRQTPWEIRSPQGPQEILGMREQITLMLQKNAITEVPPNLPGFYSNVFLVRKASGGWRPVIDLKNLNAHIHAPHFRMFTTSSVLSSLWKGDYAFKIDLQDVYFHVPIHPSSRKYLRFAFENKVYQFQVLLFRLNTAPQVFTRLASGLIPLGRLYLRPLQRHFHSLGLTDRFTPPRRSDPLVFVTQLRQWQDLRFLTSGIPIRTFQADLTIFRDASTQGWGAHMGDSQISGTWTRTDRQLHINCVELKAVISALQHWAPVLQGHQVMVATDNSTVVSYINKQGGTRSPTLLRLTVDLFLWLEAQNIIVRARHIPGCLNVIADHLSRPNQPIPTEWSLHPEIVERIFRVWSTPEVDMFATLSNSHLPRFMSPIPEPRALAVDALSQDWQGRSMYMFPPFPLLSKVIQKL